MTQVSGCCRESGARLLEGLDLIACMRAQARGASTASGCLNTSTKLRTHSDREGRQGVHRGRAGSVSVRGADQCAERQSVRGTAGSERDVTGGAVQCSAVQERGRGGTAAGGQEGEAEAGNGRRRRGREREREGEKRRAEACERKGRQRGWRGC